MECAYDETPDDYLPLDVLVQLEHLLPLFRSDVKPLPTTIDPDALRLAEGFSEWWEEDD